jgi:hypothetical protein
MRRLLSFAGLAHAGSIKADPLLISAIAIISAAAAPAGVLDSFELGFWLFVGSLCGVCFVLFGDEKKALTPRAVMGKLSICFGPGFCLTGLGIKLSGVEVSAETVLAVSLILSVAGPVILPMLVKKAGDKIDGGGV